MQWIGRYAPWAGLLALLTSIGCTRDNPAFGDGGGSGGKGSGTGTSTGEADSMDAGEMPSGAAETNGSAEGTDDDGTTTAADGTTGFDGCVAPPIELLEYGPCRADCTECLEAASPGPVLYDLSACSAACIDDCQCPDPETGDAVAGCKEGLCALDCSQGETCPNGMTCFEGGCMWTEAYGPCDETCLSGYCFLIPKLGVNVCPAVSCLDGVTEDVSLCPPPPGGTATPVCFEPQNPPELQGEGWCVLNCSGEQTCPPGMVCQNNSCFHPPA